MTTCVRCKSPITVRQRRAHGKEHNQCEKCWQLWKARGPRIVFRIRESDVFGNKVGHD